MGPLGVTTIERRRAPPVGDPGSDYGSALTLINQFNALFGSDPIQILPVILVYVTPFAVIAISQLAGIRQAGYDANEERVQRTREHFFATALSHGIPARAVTIGLIIGAINSAIILTAAFLRAEEIGTLPIALIGQACALPVLFGFLSQAIAYRRAAKLIAKLRVHKFVDPESYYDERP